MVHITITVKNQQILKKLEAYMKTPEKFGMFTVMAKKLLFEWWFETFKKQGARGGHTKWRPLTPAYAKWKRVNGKNRKILQMDGVLINSLRIKARTATSLTLSTDDPKAEFHQTGMGNNPVREFMFLTPKDLRIMSKLAAKILGDVK